CVLFFFQAEDGIRDLIVTGVQTCALPILTSSIGAPRRRYGYAARGAPIELVTVRLTVRLPRLVTLPRPPGGPVPKTSRRGVLFEIGRASCRERVEVWVVGGGLDGRRGRGV